VRGLANLIGSLFIKRHLGNNEYRLRLKKDMELCCMLDVNRPPVYNPALPYPLDPEDLEFIDLKAPLVLYMLDKRMCKGGGTLGLSRVLPKILVSAMSGELAQNAISTHYFLRLCRKVSGFDTKIFAEQWIYKSGCPKFSFSFNFNRKKMVVEIFMKQENTNSSLNADSSSSIQASQDGAVGYQDFMTPLFTGNLTVRIHEADGTPYEHILDIQSNKHKFEVQFNTKYKRIRRNTKRFLAKQAAAAAAVAEEEQENEENGEGTTVLGIIPSLGLGMPIFEDPTQKKEWKVIEWGQDEEDTSGAASAMFDWIRLDAEFEWLCICEFKQPDYMWAAQLTKDRDVVAQHEAIEALKHMPSLATSTSLLRAILDQKCFYKIRMEAAYGLSTVSLSLFLKEKTCIHPSLF
jgi:transcription initiation factor TFIID subunit 2